MTTNLSSDSPSIAPPRRSAVVLFNPVAGRRKRRRLDALIAAIGRHGCVVTLRETAGPGDAVRLAGAVTRAEADVLVVAGGDGTVNEAINGRPAEGPPLAILPMGTANLLAMELGLTSSVEELARMVVYGPAAPAWPARIGNRLFLLMAGAGFDAHVVARQPAPLKRALGKRAYVLTSLRLLMNGFAFPAYDVEVDGVSCRAASVIVAKGHFYAGPYVCARAAGVDKKGLQVCLFERPGRLQVMRYALGMFFGRLESLAGYRVVPARRVEIRAPAGEPLQVDGDAVSALPATIECAAAPIPLVRPTAA